MERETRIGIEIGEPVSAPRHWHAADVDPARDVVENDLQLSRLAAVTSGRGDVDGLAALKRRIDIRFGRCHVSTAVTISGQFYSRGFATPSRISDSERRCCPSSSKLSGDSHASNAARTPGHSPSTIENQAVSRLRPLTTMCWRKTPSNTNPNLSAARRDGRLSASHFHSKRR